VIGLGWLGSGNPCPDQAGQGGAMAWALGGRREEVEGDEVRRRRRGGLGGKASPREGRCYPLRVDGLQASSRLFVD